MPVQYANLNICTNIGILGSTDNINVAFGCQTNRYNNL